MTSESSVENPPTSPSTTAEAKKPKRLRFAWLLFPVTVLALAASLLAFLGDWHWVIDMLSHFRMQFAGGFALVLVLSVLLRQPWAGILAFIGLIVQVVQVAPFYSKPAVQTLAQTPDFTVVLSNLLTQNPSREELLEWVEESNPDVIALLEVSQEWLDHLDPLWTAWPHRISKPRDDNFGVALYSRHPLHDASFWEPERPAEGFMPSLVCTLRWQEQDVPLILTHPIPPVRGWASEARNRQLGLLAQHEAALQPLSLFLGDLNATPWSVGYRLFEDTPLRDARKGFGVMPTWPTSLPFLLRIPIDHVLVGPGWHVLDMRLGPPIGSDHLPVIARLKPIRTP